MMHTGTRVRAANLAQRSRHDRLSGPSCLFDCKQLTNIRNRGRDHFAANLRRDEA